MWYTVRLYEDNTEIAAEKFTKYIWFMDKAGLQSNLRQTAGHASACWDQSQYNQMLSYSRETALQGAL